MFRELDETQLDNHLISLISRRFSPFTHERDPQHRPFPNHHIADSYVTLCILWVDTTYTISLPEYISCKQLWIRLAYFSSIQLARDNDQLLDSNFSTHFGFPSTRFLNMTKPQLQSQPIIQLAISTTAVTALNLNLKTAHEILKQLGPSITVRISHQHPGPSSNLPPLPPRQSSSPPCNLRDTKHNQLLHPNLTIHPDPHHGHHLHSPTSLLPLASYC